MGKEHKQSLPDDESFDIVIEIFITRGSFDHVLKYIDLNLESGYPLSMKAFENCVKLCVKNGRLDTLLSIIDRCKVHAFAGFFTFHMMYSSFIYFDV